MWQPAGRIQTPAHQTATGPICCHGDGGTDGAGVSTQSCRARPVSLADAAEVSDEGVTARTTVHFCLDALVVADDNRVCWSIPKEMLQNGEYIAVYNISL